MRSNGRPVITEAKLRRIIRDELAREYLVQEGFLDFIAKPFKKLNDKAKKTVAAKAEEILKKISSVASKLKELDSAKSFLKNFESQEGGVPAKKLVSMIDLSDLSKMTDEIKNVDINSLVKKEPVKEGMSYEDFRMSLILIEEDYDQRYGHQILNESVLAAATGFWWAGTKSVVGICGLISFALGNVVKIAKFMGFEKLAEFFKKCEHFVDNVEEKILETFVFPKPVQYAAYRALHALKSKVDKANKKEGPGDSLSYEQFTSSEGKEEKETALKTLKAAVIMILVVEAFIHIIEGVGHFLHSLTESASDAIEASKHVVGGAQHAGVEAAEFSKTARAALRAGEEMSAASGIAAASATEKRS